MGRQLFQNFVKFDLISRTMLIYVLITSIGNLSMLHIYIYFYCIYIRFEKRCQGQHLKLTQFN